MTDRVYWGWARRWRVPHAFVTPAYGGWRDLDKARSLCGRVRAGAAERLDGHPPDRPCLGCVDIGIARGHFPTPAETDAGDV